MITITLCVLVYVLSKKSDAASVISLMLIPLIIGMVIDAALTGELLKTIRAFS